jgi:hypothetical protein
MVRYEIYLTIPHQIWAKLHVGDRPKRLEEWECI